MYCAGSTAGRSRDRQASLAPAARPRVRFCDLFARHARGDPVAKRAGHLIAGLGGLVQPQVGGNGIVLDTAPKEVRRPENTLRAGVSLFGGQPGPAHRRAIVLRNAVPEVVRRAEETPSDGVPLLGGLTGPAHRLTVVLHNPTPEVVRLSEDSLPDRVALLGSQTGPAHRLYVVLHNPTPEVVRLSEDSLPERVSLVLDNYATHKHAKVKRWLAARPRFHLHFTPTSASWLNQVERWFGLLSQRAIKRGSFRSVADLVDKIQAFIDAYNTSATPFVWVATAQSILDKVARIAMRISGTAR